MMLASKLLCRAGANLGPVGGGNVTSSALNDSGQAETGSNTEGEC